MPILSKPLTPIPYDGVSHHSLGGPSHTFRKHYAQHLANLVRNGPVVMLNLMVQPNNSPHVGTLSSVILTFVLAMELKTLGLQPHILFDLCDNANDSRQTLGGVVYQKGLRASGKLEHLNTYFGLFTSLAGKYPVPFRVRMEADFLSEPEVPRIIKAMVQRREELGMNLGGGPGKIGIRAPCPVEGCGLVDKHGVHNGYSDSDTVIRFLCPIHGRFSLDIDDDVTRFQFNNVFWTLMIGMLYERAPYGYIMMCGSDYAGFWQEQIIWRHIESPILIVYTPLIIDWSGSKISKSLYLKKGAYKYLQEAGQDYLCSYDVMKEQGKDLGALCEEIQLWVDEPYRLFRSYSLQYLHLVFERSPIVNTDMTVFQST